MRVKFIKDFATKRIGDVVEYDGPLASYLVRSDEVAEFTEEDVTPVNTEAEHLPVKSETEIESEIDETEVAEFTEEVEETTAKTKKPKK